MTADVRNDGGESFLSRWSRLKRKEPTATETVVEPVAEPAVDVSAEGGLPPSEVADPTPEAADPPPDLPDVETLDRDSDYKPFLAANVPTALRNAALRKLWRSDPVFANLDGLNDYDGDFTIASDAVGVVTKAVEKAAEKIADAERRISDRADTSIDTATDAPDSGAPDPDTPDPSSVSAGVEGTRVEGKGVEGTGETEPGRQPTRPRRST